MTAVVTNRSVAEQHTPHRTPRPAVGSTVLNQSGQSIEVVVIWMTVYLGLSITVSLIMNWFNAKMALVER